GAIAFYLANRAEIDAYLAAEEVAFDAIPQPLQTSDPALYNKLQALIQLATFRNQPLTDLMQTLGINPQPDIVDYV
ncbi:MAG: hypothetical protein HC789_08410, partial [Microcoleus sp. CSU_2_2]|nr:hypothetical protein [Microcoleus sp. CSU_2_2]